MKNLLSLFVMAVIMQPMVFKAQSPAHRTLSSAELAEKKVGWQAFKFDDNGTNVRNGVEFYTQQTECSTKKSTSSEKSTSPEKATFETHQHTVTPDMYITEHVTLAKLVNTNNYAVRVTYQLSEFSPVVNVLVSPSITLEGSCAATDGNLAKLVVKPLEGKTEEEKQKNKDYISTHIVVSAIK